MATLAEALAANPRLTVPDETRVRSQSSSDVLETRKQTDLKGQAIPNWSKRDRTSHLEQQPLCLRCSLTIRLDRLESLDYSRPTA